MDNLDNNLNNKTEKENNTTEGFVVSRDNVDEIKSNLETIKSRIGTDFPDLNKYVSKAELDVQVCRVANAIDKDNYISKAELQEELKKCPVPFDYRPEDYVLKSTKLAESCPPCPTIDTTKYVLKSTLPAAMKCPPCVAPSVKVSAGLCQKCPPAPTCPSPQPCPIPKCPEVKPCAPPPECPRCPPIPRQPVKICPSYDPYPSPTPQIKKVYVDSRGREIPFDEDNNSPLSMRNNTNDNANNNKASIFNNLISSKKKSENVNTLFKNSLKSRRFEDTTGSSSKDNTNIILKGSGLNTPNPLDNSDKDYSLFPNPTDPPIELSFNLNNNRNTTANTNTTNNKTKSCQPSAFNHEFKQYGVYGDNRRSMYN